MKYKDIQQLLDDFKNFSVLIIGDVMVDSYIWGKVTRISPEAPVPVVLSKTRENRLGGAANVVKNIHALGAKPIICSVIGKDEYGVAFKELLDQNKVTREGIIESSKRVTTAKTRIISGSQQLLRVDHETLDYIDLELQAQLIERIRKITDKQPVQAIIFQDYDKGVITPEIIAEITAMAKEKGIPTLVDPKKRNFNQYKNVTFFKPNFKELVEGLNIEIEKNDIQSVYKAAKFIHNENSIDYVMVTLSELGVLISDNNYYHQIPAEIRDIADVSGAGDTVISMAALCLAAGLPPKTIAYLSNLAGGLVCEKVGVVPITPEMLLEENIQFPK
ncbi:MAG: hypothetical protein JXJ22_06905 [Bacteroidales bacterium]|nr:hypothetical protein [Bacteroidales bacterium]